MENMTVLNKFESLPERLKKDVVDYIDKLLEKERKKNKPKKPVFGCAKGMFKMAPDFDEPSDCG